MQKAWKTTHEKWHHMNAIQNYSKNVLRLSLILLNWYLPKKWETRWVPTNDTDQWNCLWDKAGEVIPPSSSTSNFYTALPILFAIDPRWVFSFPQPDLTATSPANSGFVTSEQGLLNANRVATGGSEPRPLLHGHQNCSFPRCLHRTNTLSVWVLRIWPWS